MRIVQNVQPLNDVAQIAQSEENQVPHIKTTIQPTITG